MNDRSLISRLDSELGAIHIPAPPIAAIAARVRYDRMRSRQTQIRGGVLAAALLILLMLVDVNRVLLAQAATIARNVITFVIPGKDDRRNFARLKNVRVDDSYRAATTEKAEGIVAFVVRYPRTSLRWTLVQVLLRDQSPRRIDLLYRIHTGKYIDVFEFAQDDQVDLHFGAESIERGLLLERMHGRAQRASTVSLPVITTSTRDYTVGQTNIVLTFPADLANFVDQAGGAIFN